MYHLDKRDVAYKSNDDVARQPHDGASHCNQLPFLELLGAATFTWLESNQATMA